VSPVLALDGFVGGLLGVNVFGFIAADRVTSWHYLELLVQIFALLLGRDAKHTTAGQVGMWLAAVFLLIGFFRIVTVLAWPGMR
jgi:hypothetical protein